MNRWGRHGRWSTETARTKFASRTLPAKNGCLIWTGGRGGGGRYGIVAIAGKVWLAHRAAWFLSSGEDPGDRTVCHHCDNGLCVNVSHLFIGTQADNVHDTEAKRRSRHPRGASHGRAKLTAEQVRIIRTKLAAGVAVRALAREYGIAHGNIARIRDGIGWIGV